LREQWPEYSEDITEQVVEAVRKSGLAEWERHFNWRWRAMRGDLGRGHVVKIDGVLYAFDAQGLKLSLHDISHLLKKQ
jgi:hypothetical protein